MAVPRLQLQPLAQAAAAAGRAPAALVLGPPALPAHPLNAAGVGAGVDPTLLLQQVAMLQRMGALPQGLELPAALHLQLQGGAPLAGATHPQQPAPAAPVSSGNAVDHHVNLAGLPLPSGPAHPQLPPG